MNKSVLVNNLLNKAGLGSVSVDSIIAPVSRKAEELHKLQATSYVRLALARLLITEKRYDEARQTALLDEGARAGRIATQIEGRCCNAQA